MTTIEFIFIMILAGIAGATFYFFFAVLSRRLFREYFDAKRRYNTQMLTEMSFNAEGEDYGSTRR